MGGEGGSDGKEMDKGRGEGVDIAQPDL